MSINNFFKLIIAVGVGELAGILGSIFSVSSIPNWYAGLVKPVLNPPSWVFGPVWTILYALMGISLFLIWKSDPSFAPRERRRGVVLFFIQLFLNAIWAIIFFGMKSPGWAFVDIVALWLAIVWTMVIFRRISQLATYLLVPYILWVSFASYLNYSIWILN